jgi:hypothetical protein
VVAVVVACAVSLARAQGRAGDSVTISHIEPDSSSRPFPVLSSVGTIQPAGLYEIYFNGGVYVPGLGPREKLFVLVESMSPDGWIHVQYGDEIREKGSSNASLVAVELPDDDVVPRTNVRWLVHHTAIAAVSPKLNVNGAEARYWPE